MENLVNKVGADKIPYLSFETNVNMAGGQPCSMQNLKDVYKFCRKHNILVMLDATRAVENAYYIQQRENGYKKHSVKNLLKEIF